MNVHCTLGKWTNESKGKPEKKIGAAFGTTFRITEVSVFKGESRIYIYVSLEQGG
jgi:hypothetical protein